jgi:hypothetical protein
MISSRTAFPIWPAPPSTRDQHARFGDREALGLLRQLVRREPSETGDPNRLALRPLGSVIDVTHGRGVGSLGHPPG